MFRELRPSLLPAQRTLCRPVAAPLLPARPSQRVAAISSKQPAPGSLASRSHQQRQSLTLSLRIPASGTRADGPGAVRPGAPWVRHRQNPGAVGGAVTSLGTQPLGRQPTPSLEQLSRPSGLPRPELPQALEIPFRPDADGAGIRDRRPASVQ